MNLGVKIIQLIRLPEGAPEHVSQAVPCQCLTETFLLPTTAGGVNYLYKVSRLSLLTNSATSNLVLHSLSSSLKLKESEILLSLILSPEVHRTTSTVMSSKDRAQKSLYPIALPSADLFDKGESLLWRLYNLHNQRNYTDQTKPSRGKDMKQAGNSVVELPASVVVDVQLQHEDRCLQNWLHSGAVQLSMGFYKNSA